LTPRQGHALLQEMAADFRRQGMLSDAEIRINAPGLEKMSVILGEFIAPFADAAENLEQYEKLVTLASTAWNAALLEEDRRRSFLAEISAVFPASDRKYALSLLNTLIQRKLEYFPLINSYIVEVRVADLGDSYHLAVISYQLGQQSSTDS
jgi:hypothetical protein